MAIGFSQQEIDAFNTAVEFTPLVDRSLANGLYLVNGALNGNTSSPNPGLRRFVDVLAHSRDLTIEDGLVVLVDKRQKVAGSVLGALQANPELKTRLGYLVRQRESLGMQFDGLRVKSLAAKSASAQTLPTVDHPAAAALRKLDLKGELAHLGPSEFNTLATYLAINTSAFDPVKYSVNNAIWQQMRQGKVTAKAMLADLAQFAEILGSSPHLTTASHSIVVVGRVNATHPAQKAGRRVLEEVLSNSTLWEWTAAAIHRREATERDTEGVSEVRDGHSELDALSKALKSGGVVGEPGLASPFSDMGLPVSARESRPALSLS